LGKGIERVELLEVATGFERLIAEMDDKGWSPDARFGREIGLVGADLEGPAIGKFPIDWALNVSSGRPDFACADGNEY